MAVELYDKFLINAVRVIGTSIESIRAKIGALRSVMKSVSLVLSEIVMDIEAGKAFSRRVGYPVIVRPAYT